MKTTKVRYFNAHPNDPTNSYTHRSEIFGEPKLTVSEEWWYCYTCDTRVDKDAAFCPHCQREFFNFFDENTITCEICGKQHKYMVMDETPPKICTDCDELLKNKYDIKDVARAFYNKGKNDAAILCVPKKE